MGNISYKLEKAGLALAGAAFRIAFYVCMAVLIFWCGKHAYQFGYDVFNQQAMSPGDGTEVVVTIPEGVNDYQIGQILKRNGLIEDARVFYVQEFLTEYRGVMKAGTYTLSTAYTPRRIMSILAGADEEEDSA